MKPDRVGMSVAEAVAKALADGTATEGRGVNYPPGTPEPPLEPGLSEKRFTARVVALAESRGWLAYHTHDSRRSRAGFPDLVLVRRGEILFAELKVGKNKATAEQVAWLDALRETGAAAGVWRPEDWPKIREVLE